MLRKNVLLTALASVAMMGSALGQTASALTAQAVSGLDIARQLNETFVQIASQASASVVVITVTQKAGGSTRQVDSYDYTEDPWEEFRRFLQQRDGELPPASSKTTGEGSGIIIRRNGYILTNRHVVEDADTVEVRLQDGRILKGEVRGEDAPADVAVIKINADDLPVARLGDSSKTRVGEMAIAIGAPFSLDYSTTFGHISAKHRGNLSADTDDAQSLQDQDFIQTDASINPGNSGGPLVNIEGEVIGINTLIRGIHTGIGFAIPINLARQIAERLIRDGKFPRPFLGISVKSLRDYPEYRDFVGRPVQDGVLVSEISLDGPAAASTLRVEDIITAIDGRPVSNVQQFRDELREKKPGKDLTLDVLRKGPDGGKHFKITIRPVPAANTAEPADDDALQGQGNPFGIAAKTVSEDLMRKYNLQLAEGVVITKIDKSGPAYLAGLAEGDIITSIGDITVANARQYREALGRISIEKGCVIQYVSQGNRKFEILKTEGN